MTDEYTISAIKRFLRHKLEDNSSGELFEFDFQNDCRDVIDVLPFGRNSGKGLLFTFASVAGGWEVEVGRRLLEHSGECIGVNDDFREITNIDLSVVQEAGYGMHPHRNAHGAHPKEPLNDLATIEVNGHTVNSMSELFEVLKNHPMSTPATANSLDASDIRTTFDLAINVFEDIHTFGTLTAFDFLECAIRVNEQEWLTPPRLKVAHVNRNGPGKALERIVADEEANVNLTQSEEAQEVLDELSRFVREELGLSHEAAIFDVETCLCAYHGKLEDEGPGRNGSCT